MIYACACALCFSFCFLIIIIQIMQYCHSSVVRPRAHRGLCGGGVGGWGGGGGGGGGGDCQFVLPPHSLHAR